MKEELLHEIELEPHKAPTMHPFPHPYGMPTTSTIPSADQLKREEILVQVGFLISHPKWIRFESNSDRKSTRLNSSHSGESRMPSSA